MRMLATRVRLTTSTLASTARFSSTTDRSDFVKRDVMAGGAVSGGTGADRKERKRFYKLVKVCEAAVGADAGKAYEIILDHRKLKTPGGNLFVVNSEKLAQLVAQEWRSQTYTIKLTTMHLTSLVNTCIDNPTRVTREQLMANIHDYLQTDTLLYFDSASVEKLEKAQEAQWLPLIEWMNKRFNDLDLKVQRDLNIVDTSNRRAPSAANNSAPDLDNAAVNAQSPASQFDKFLADSFDLNALIAFNYMCECLKSVILSVALLERRLSSVEEACALAMLEQSHQYDQWGKVEWYHDVNEQEMRSRVSAALLFIYLSNSAKYFQAHNKIEKNAA